VAVDEISSNGERIRAHKIVISHKEAKLALGLLDKIPDVGVITQIPFVQVKANFMRKLMGVFLRDRLDRFSLRGVVLADYDLKIVKSLSEDGIEQGSKATCPVVGRNTHG
jgi:hypothetical protein